MAKKRADPQGKRAYVWQWAHRDWNRATISFDEAKKLVKEACDFWDIHPPRHVVRFSKKTAFSVYRDDDQVLGLIPDHMNPATVLHEVAHHIVHVRYGTKYPDHGADWLGVYLDLLAHFKIGPLAELQAGVKSYRLKYRMPKEKAA